MLPEVPHHFFYFLFLSFLIGKANQSLMVFHYAQDGPHYKSCNDEVAAICVINDLTTATILCLPPEFISKGQPHQCDTELSC